MSEPKSVSTMSFAALRQHEFPPQFYVIDEGILAKNGMLIIGGPPKSYKSFVNTSIAYHLLTGTPLFGAYRSHSRKIIDAFTIPKPQKVLLLEQEIGFYDTRERLLPLYQSAPPEHKEALDTNLFIHSRDHTMQLDNLAGVKRIDEIIKAVKPDVVMFDPLIEFHSSNENDTQHMNRIMLNLMLLQENHDFSMVITHHTGKAGDNFKVGLDLLRGSSVIAGKLDTAFLLTVKNRNAGLIKVESIVRRGKPINNMLLKLDWQTLKGTFHEWTKGSGNATLDAMLKQAGGGDDDEQMVQ